MDDRSPAASSLPSRTASPVNGAISSRPSVEIKREEPSSEQKRSSSDSVRKTDDVSNHPQELEQQQQQQPEEISVEPPAIQIDEPRSSRPSFDFPRLESMRPSLDLSRPPSEPTISPKVNGNTATAGLDTPSYEKQTIEQMRSDFEVAELRRQEETHTYLCSPCLSISAMRARSFSRSALSRSSRRSAWSCRSASSFSILRFESSSLRSAARFLSACKASV